MKLRSFLELCYVLRRFMPNLARLVAPLNKLLRKAQPPTFQRLNDEDPKSMHSLKNAFILPRVLALPNSTGHLGLDIDACDIQVGCVFLQELPDKTVKPIEYWPRSLFDAKRQYESTKRVSCYRADCISITPVLRKYQIHYEDRPRLPDEDPESDG